MAFLIDNCAFSELTEQILIGSQPFSCGNDDLDDFFRNDVTRYAHYLMGKTYCFRLQDDLSQIVCAFTVSNDSVRVDHLPNSRKKRINEAIPHEKQMRRYPAVLIGRLGVNVKYANKGIGSELLSIIKRWFIQPDNKTGCRYLAVDSYNLEQTLNYYEKNGFHYLFSTEEQEAENSHLSVPLKTRYMYFDLIDLINVSRWNNK